MFQVNDDLSIYVTRGDVVYLKVSADNGGKPYTFEAGEVVRLKIYGKKNADNVVLQKDFPVVHTTQGVEIILTEADTKIGSVVNKPVDYWYEVELNPYDNPQTIIGYDEDGAKLFRLFPEGADVPEYEPPKPEDIPIVDEELDMTSPRPVQNQAIARAFANLKEGYEATHEAVAALHVTPQMFGAIGDGVADDTEAIQKAADYCAEHKAKLYLPKNADGYKVSKLTIKDVTSIKFDGVIYVTEYIEIKENSQSPIRSDIEIAGIIGELRLHGLNTAIVKINKCSTLKLFSTDGNNDYIGYSSFYLGDVPTLVIHTEKLGWVNENIFIGGRITNLVIEGNRAPEDNLFIKPMFENATVNIVNGYRNRFENCRFEGDNTVHCCAGTYGNRFEKTFFQNKMVMYCKHQTFDNWVDEGDNIYVKDTGTKSESLISLNKFSNPYNLPIVGDNIVPATTFARLFVSDIVPLPNTPILIEFINPSANVDIRINLYDLDKNLLTESEAITAPQLSLNDEGNYSLGESSVTKIMALIYPNKDAKYVRISLLGMGEPMSIDNLEVRVSYKESESIQAFIDGFKSPVEGDTI